MQRAGAVFIALILDNIFTHSYLSFFPKLTCPKIREINEVIKIKVV